MPGCAARRIADIVAERLDLILPPATELPATTRAGLEALSAIAAARAAGERALERDGLDRLFREIELPLIPVLARMEAVGVALDREALAALDSEFAAEIDAARAGDLRDVGHEFNLGSPKQLEQVLFYELDLPKGKRTKTGYSTDASVLEDLRPAHPMIDKLLEWRTYTKLRSTYVEALPTLIAADGRLHTTFHQAVAATGRLSSSDPNLQNIPIRTRARSADPARVRRRRPGRDAGGGRLLADRAAHPGPRVRRRAPQRCLRAQGRHPSRDRGARPPQGAERRDRGRAVDGQDGQLRDRLRDERLRAVEPGRTSRARRPRTSSTAYFATYSGISYYMLAHQGIGPAAGLRHDAPRSQAPDPRARRRATRACAPPASGWRSTCRSRARPPTSSRSR